MFPKNNDKTSKRWIVSCHRWVQCSLALQAGPSRVDNEDGVGECPAMMPVGSFKHLQTKDCMKMDELLGVSWLG